MSRRVRIAAVTVTLAAFLDDDDADTLTPLQVQPVSYVAADWPLFDLEDVRQQIETAALAQLASPAEVSS